MSADGRCSRTSTATTAYGCRRSTTSAAARSINGGVARPTTLRTDGTTGEARSATSASRWRSEPGTVRPARRLPGALASPAWRSTRSAPASPPRSPAPGGRADAVTLVAVSKLQPQARVRAVLDAGQRVFGENRVQEAEGRWPPLRAGLPGRSSCTSSGRCRPTSSRARSSSSTRSTASTATGSPASSPTRCRPAAPARRCSSRSTPAASRRRPGSIPTALDGFLAACRGPTAAGRRADGDPAGGRRPGAAFRAAARPWPPATASPGCRWA